MRGFCDEFAEQKHVDVDFAAHDVPDQLSSDISLCLFRVLQEALHNAAKHSGVEHFDVELWGARDEIHLVVSDPGKGFDLGRSQGGRSRAWPRQHGRATEARERGSLDRNATAAWHQDPRSCTVSFRKLVVLMN